MNHLKPTISPAIMFLAILIALIGCAETPMRAEPSNAPGLRITETDEGFLVTEGSEKVLFYQRKPKSLGGKYARSNYVHPLYGLDGEILTVDFPEDHPFHRGIFWAWRQQLLGDKPVGSSWRLTDISFDIYDAQVLPVDAESSALKIQAFWKSPLWTGADGREKPFLKGTTIIRIHRSSGDFRKIDFQISLLALEDKFRLGGAKDEKGYGGFSTRIRLPEGMKFTSNTGEIEPQLLAIKAGPWMDFSGHFGKPGKVSGLAVLCHRSIPGYPSPWILRRKGSMQNPVYPGRIPVPISTEKPLVLRYRLVVHRGCADHVDLDKLQAEFNAEKPFL